jgi:hypothetical protein
MLEFTPACRRRVEKAGRQARRMLQKIGNCRFPPFGTPPLAEMRIQMLVERHSTFRDQAHDDRGGRHGLSERREIEHCIDAS